MNNKFEDIYDILKQDKRIVSEDGNILKNKLSTLAMNMDETLLNILISNDITKDLFFKEIDNILVFDKIKFSWIINSKDFLPDSYTAFKNKIMLVDDNGESIKNSSNVVLSFPFKDCVLEADSTQEKDKREEVFYNETLMKNEIDTLLAPKVFTNAKRYNLDGVENVSILDDKDNLIIKGNNLLALHSLVPSYKGKIKCMYWDILYNTDNDQVPYNDSFKHTSWLTMMKNRLEVAKELLKSTGCIFIQLDNNEMAYLKVMCDEIFGRENHVTTITCKVKAPSGVASGAQMFFDSSEYILCYAKDKKILKYNSIKVDTEVISQKSKTASNYNLILNSIDYAQKEFLKEIDGIKIYKLPSSAVDIQKMSREDMTEESYYNKREIIFRTASLSGGTEKKVKAYIDSLEKNDGVFIYEYIPQKGKNKGSITSNLIYKKSAVLMLKDYIKVDHENKKIIKQDYITNIFNNDWWQGIASEGNVKLKNGKKPEILIKTLLDTIITDKEDIFLDAYLGSGTSASVAHKMGIKYIGIEQLDSHVNLSVDRLKGVVLNLDKGPVSKMLKWNGGGSFVYCELKALSQELIDKITSSKNNDLNKIYDELKGNEFVTYRINSDVFEKTKEEFNVLTEDDKRKFLIEIIDKNTLYVNYSEIDDESYNISKKDKEFNNSFYKKEV